MRRRWIFVVLLVVVLFPFARGLYWVYLLDVLPVWYSWRSPVYEQPTLESGGTLVVVIPERVTETHRLDVTSSNPGPALMLLKRCLTSRASSAQYLLLIPDDPARDLVLYATTDEHVAGDPVVVKVEIAGITHHRDSVTQRIVASRR